MKHMNFSEEIGEISQNTLSKVAQSHFCMENSEISQINEHKNTQI